MAYVPEVNPNSSFSWSNFPFGVFSTEQDPSTRCATAIGDLVLDLSLVAKQGVFSDDAVNIAFAKPDLSVFAALPVGKRYETRQRIIQAVKSGEVKRDFFLPLKGVTMHLPMEIKGFTDFLCSKEHLNNCSAISGRPNPDNFFRAPSAYNGRASSVQPSPHHFYRLKGVTWQSVEGKEKCIVFGPSKCIDYELEMGALISTPIPYGETVETKAAPEHIFGFVLLNDWSARDMQHFEMEPLGPMNSKSYATTISPWVVTLDALSPYACKPLHLATTESYLHHLQIPDVSCATFDINLEVFLRRNDVDYKICSSNLKGLLWTPFQQLAHQASSGCGFRTGDLLGTGTISNSETDETGTKIGLGCLFEATKGGYSKYQFKDGTQLGYLEDYDSIVIRARCGGLNGFGFGDCIGTLLPSYP